MGITYKETHIFTEKELEELFLSVDWSSGHYPDKLAVHKKDDVFFCEPFRPENDVH